MFKYLYKYCKLSLGKNNSRSRFPAVNERGWPYMETCTVKRLYWTSARHLDLRCKFLQNTNLIAVLLVFFTIRNTCFKVVNLIVPYIRWKNQTVKLPNCKKRDKIHTKKENKQGLPTMVVKESKKDGNLAWRKWSFVVKNSFSSGLQLSETNGGNFAGPLCCSHLLAREGAPIFLKYSKYRLRAQYSCQLSRKAQRELLLCLNFF